MVFDDTYDPNGNEEDDQMSIPSDGSDISGGNSSSNSDSDSSSEGDEEEEMYDEVSIYGLFMFYTVVL